MHRMPGSTENLKELVYKSKWLALVSHWVVQSILYMDWTERLFKVGLDVILTLAFYSIVQDSLRWQLALTLAFVTAHTLNFLANAHVASALKLFGLCKHPPEHLLRFGDSIGTRLRSSQWILCAGIWGGFARSEHSAVSDLDIFVVRRGGLLAGLSASFQALLARSQSLLQCIPLDFYVLDSFEALSRLRADEIPIILCDADGLLQQKYPMAGSLSQYVGQAPLKERRPDNWAIWLSLTLVITAIPAIVLVVQNNNSLFLFLRLARVAHYWEAGRIGTAPLGNFAGTSFDLRLGSDFILMILGQATGLSLSRLPGLGVGSLIIPTVYFALAKRLSESNFIASLLAVYIGYNHTLLPNHYNVFIYTWTHTLFLVAIVIMLKIAQTGKSVADSIALLILFVGSFLSYHTTSMWVLVVVPSFSLLVTLFSAFLKHSERSSNVQHTSSRSGWSVMSRQSLINLGIAFMVLYMTYDPIIYHIYLPHLKSSPDVSPFSTLYRQLMIALGTEELAALPPYQQTVITSPTAAVLSLIIIVLIILPILLDTALTLLELWRSRKPDIVLTPLRALWVSFLVVAVFHGAVYSTYMSGVSFKLVHLLLPFGTLFSLQQISKKLGIPGKILCRAFIIALVGTAVWAFTEYSQHPHQAAPRNLGSSITRIAKSSSDRTILLTDLDTYARYLFYGEQVGVHFDHQRLDSQHYVAVTNWGVSEQSADFDYVVVDFQHIDKALWDVNWDTYEPFSMHLDEIETNQELSRIYDNGQVIVYEAVVP
jgi:hypothetical protein